MDVEVDKSWLRSGAGEARRCGCGCDIRQVSEYHYGLGSVRRKSGMGSEVVL